MQQAVQACRPSDVRDPGAGIAADTLPRPFEMVVSDGEAPPSLRVLVVDDNRDAATSLAEILRMSGHTVCSAYDGMEALAIVRGFQPHALLLDIGLPRLSGHAVARQLRAQTDGANLLLVALSGWGQDADRQASAEAGFDVHLVKPVDLQVLLRLLAEHLPPTRAQNPRPG